MKTAQRHQLKEDEFLVALDRGRTAVAENSKSILLALGVVLVAAVSVSGYILWSRSVNDKAAAMYADAVVTASAPVTPPQTLTPPGQPAPPKPAISFPTEQARTEAAVQKFNAAAQAYPSTPAGIASTYRAGSLLVESGKFGDAEAKFNDVLSRDGNGLYGQMARLGIASIQLETKKYDQAINTLQAMSQRTDGDLPVDGILMQLGDAYKRAGRMPEAVRAYTRVVDEFPKSPYLADARRQLDDLKAAQAASRS